MPDAERPVLPPPTCPLPLSPEESLHPELLDSFISESDQALWLWHVSIDQLSLSAGAKKILGLEGDAIPQTMDAYISHLPRVEQDRLRHTREECLRSNGEHFARALYFFDHHQVLDQAFVLRRDAQGQADHVLGCLDVMELEQGFSPLQGHWLVNFEQDSVRFDANCARMLGREPAAFTCDIRTSTAMVHDAEHQHLVDMQRICLSARHGDHYSDTVLFRQTSGAHILMLLSMSVLTRNKRGRAELLAGSLQPALPDKSSSANRLALALYNSGDGMWDWDLPSNTVYYSPRYLSMLGYTNETFPPLTSSWLRNIHPDDYAATVPVQMAIAESPENGNSFELTYRMRRADGSWTWILGRGHVTHRDQHGKATRMIGMHTDISTTQLGRARLEDMVKRDTLTGLCSRTYFEMALNDLQQHPVWPLSVLACDINGLKLINDYLGHAAGDDVLIRAASFLRRSLRMHDCVARTGGDEFIALLPHCSEAQARRIMVEIQRSMDNCNDGSRVPALLSLGTATGNGNISPEELLSAADRDMMEHKQQHRHVCQQQIKSWIESHRQITVSLNDSRCDED